MAVARDDADQVGGPDMFVPHSRVATTVKYIASVSDCHDMRSYSLGHL